MATAGSYCPETAFPSFLQPSSDSWYTGSEKGLGEAWRRLCYTDRSVYIYYIYIYYIYISISIISMYNVYIYIFCNIYHVSACCTPQIIPWQWEYEHLSSSIQHLQHSGCTQQAGPSLGKAPRPFLCCVRRFGSPAGLSHWETQHPQVQCVVGIE